MSKLSSSKKPSVQTVSNLSKPQQGLSNSLVSQLMSSGTIPSGLGAIQSGISDPNQYTAEGAFGQNMLNYFNQQLAPSIMNMFSGAGTANSGGARTAITREAGNLTNSLASTLAPYQLQQRGLNMQGGDALRNYLAQALNPTIGSSSQGPSQMSQIGSTIGSIGSLLGLSDRRLKEEIEPVADVLEKLRGLKCYTYLFKGGDGVRQLGLIAQEVEERFPEAVQEVGGIKCVNLYALVSLLVAATGELAEREVSYAEQ